MHPTMGHGGTSLTMIDYDGVAVNRLPDKASPARLSLTDKYYTWRLSRKKGVTCGNDVTFKKGVEISICETGSLIIHDKAFFHADVWLLLTLPRPVVKIGRWVHVGRQTIIACKNNISIGDFTVFAPGCYIIDHEHGLSTCDIILNQRSVLKEVVIGRDCYFGARTVVLGGATIGDGAIIGAGSVVTGAVPPYEVWAGNPARYIKDR